MQGEIEGWDNAKEMEIEKCWYKCPRTEIHTVTVSVSVNRDKHKQRRKKRKDPIDLDVAPAIVVRQPFRCLEYDRSRR